jgi:TldD protein
LVTSASELALVVELVASAEGRCPYAEARYVRRIDEDLAVRNGAVDRAGRLVSEGIGVRVRIGGAWGFAATPDVTRAGAERALQRAIAIAAAQPSAPGRPRLPEPPAQGHWESPCETDPTTLSLDTKLAPLFAADAALREHGGTQLVVTSAAATVTHLTQAFASTEGSAYTQTRTETGAGIQAIAAVAGEVQTRTYPGTHGVLVRQAGWEHVHDLDLTGHAPRVASEAIALCTAPQCPQTTTSLVLGAEQLAYQVHESIGHALELDRIQLGEAAYAGTSWVRTEDLGTLRYGSDQLTISADGTIHGGLGTFGWDDEGTAGRRVLLVEDGMLRSALSDRESAAVAGLPASTGCARASGFDRQPVVRMTNVSLEPGEAGTLQDLLADTGEGIYCETNRSWSIDDRRLNFQFATEIAYEIKDGELGRLLRNPSYHGVTPEFWAKLDAVCGPEEWSLWGVTNCGKAEPGQTMAVSHGAAPARFRDVEVGVA